MRRRVPAWLVIGVLLAGGVPGAALAQESAEAYLAFLTARRLEADGDEAGALAALGRAAEADPEAAEVRAEMAAFHLRHDDTRAAEREARAALAIEQSNPGANRVLGMINAAALEDLRGPDAAEEAAIRIRDGITHLERAVAGTPASSDIVLHYTLGQLYLRDNQPRRAVEALVRVMNENPLSAQVRITLAQAYAGAGDLARATRTLEEVVERQPGVAVLLAQYQEMAGRFADAAESYTRALTVQPQSRQLMQRRIIALLNADEHERAASFAADARRQFPQDRRFLQLHGQALFDGGDRSGAFALLEQAVRDQPDDADTLFTLADLYYDAGRQDDAEETLRRVVAVQPQHSNALNYLGYLLAVRGENLDEAIDLVERALEQEPENGAYLDSLGWAYFKRGDLDEAEKYLAAAAERLPENSEVQDHLGDVLARQGRFTEAIAAWTRALDGDRRDVEADTIERKISDARAKAADQR